MAQKTTDQATITIPESAYIRDQQRWSFIFFGVWDALQNLSPQTRIALGKVLTRAGLGAGGFLDQRVLLPFPSQDIVDRAKRFYSEAVGLKDLRGMTRRIIPPWCALPLYDLVY